MNVSFGAHVWGLPPQELEYPKCVEKYKWFARFFLEGEICSKLAPYSQHLLSRPSSMIKSWAKLQPRTEALLRQLVDKDVDSKARLDAVWAAEKHYLLQSYLQWIPESKQEVVKKIWPPL